jgi:hypothetical protein
VEPQADLWALTLTFSTNEKLFPTEIAVNVHGTDWEVGKKPRKEIERAGFLINPVKTRCEPACKKDPVSG